MRHRVFRDSGTLATGHWIWWKYNPTQLQSDVPVSYTNYHRYEDSWDVVTERFKERQAKGEIINNPFYLQQHTWSLTPATLVRSGTLNAEQDRAMRQEGFISPVLTGVPIQMWMENFDAFFDQWPSPRDVAVTQAWANADASEMKLLAALGEARETIHWIRSLLQRGINLLRQVKWGTLTTANYGRSVKKQMDDISQAWLELRYAFRPLVFDLVNTLKALKKSIENGRQTARGWNRWSDETVTTTQATSSPFSWTVHSEISHGVNYRAGVLYRLIIGLGESLSIWGGDQAIDAIWELTPFSFIIDWFFNVGNTIASWMPRAGLYPLTSWVTEEYWYNEIVTISNIGVLANDGSIRSTITGQTPGSGTYTARIKRRTPCPPRAILPTFDLKLDVGKIVDLAFIGRQLVDRKFKLLRTIAR